MLVIPASVVVDWMVHHYLLPWPAILGVVIILLGFFGLVFSEAFEALYHNKQECPTHPPSSEYAINTAPINTAPGNKWRRHLTGKKLLRYVI